MIKPLRKKHLQVWWLLAVLLPAGIITAVPTRKEIPASTVTLTNGQNKNSIVQPPTINQLR